MDTKLTLSLDKGVIEQAKKYAKKRNTSLSKLVESYLDKVCTQQKDEFDISPLVKSLSGVVKLARKGNPRKSYSDFLIRKYKG